MELKKDNPSTTWFWKDWGFDTRTLSYAERGMWVELIGIASASVVLGEWTGPMSDLIVVKESMESAWRLLVALGTKKVAEVEVMIKGEMVPIVAETFKVWEGFAPVDLTPVRVVCRRLVKQRVRNEGKAMNMRKYRKATTNEPQDDHGTTTDEPQTNHKKTTNEPQKDHMTCANTRARTSPILSTTDVVDSSSSAVEKIEAPPEPANRRRKRKDDPGVDEAFVAEWEKRLEPQGINVRLELEKAKMWLSSNPHRKLNRRFVTNWICKAQPNARALAAAKREEECNGERPCPVLTEEEWRRQMMED